MGLLVELQGRARTAHGKEEVNVGAVLFDWLCFAARAVSIPSRPELALFRKIIPNDRARPQNWLCSAKTRMGRFAGRP